MTTLLLPLVLSLAAPAQPQFEDCDEYYYGLGRAKDLRKAFDCYKRHQEWEMLVVVYLNGEGTARDVARAREAYGHISPEDRRGRPATFGKLEELLAARERDPKLRVRIDYCDDVAQDTVTMNGCLRVAAHRAQQAQDAALATVRKGLAPAAALALDAVSKAFTPFVEAEKHRTYLDFIEGSVRGQAAVAQTEFVRRQFEARVRALLRERGPLTSSRPYATADAELNQVYRGVVQGYVSGCEERAQQASSEADRAQQLEWAEDYKKTARETQRHWIRYRDAWAELMAEARPDLGRTEVMDAVKALITDDRITELRHNPMGGD